MALERLLAERFAREAIGIARATSRERVSPPRYLRPEDAALSLANTDQPWHVRYRPWLILGGMAAGFFAMRWLLERKGKKLVENPKAADDPATWMAPLDMGPPFVPPKESMAWAAPLFDEWIFDTAGIHYIRDSKDRQEATDIYISFSQAIGWPLDVPSKESLEYKILHNFVSHVRYDISSLHRLKTIVERSKLSQQDFENLWFVIYNPWLLSFTIGSMEMLFSLIHDTPERDRWKIQWITQQLVIETDEIPITVDGMYMMQIERYMTLPYNEFVKRFAPTREDMWLEVFDRTPEKELVKLLVDRNVFDFNVKAYLRAYKALREEKTVLREADAIHGAVALQFVFGDHWKVWLDGMKERGIGAHDATMWLPEEPSPGLAKFLKTHTLVHSQGESGRRYAVLGKPLEELATIARSWNTLKTEEKDLPYKQVLRLATTGSYEKIASEEFAREATRWGVPSTIYPQLEKRWLGAIRSQDLPQIEVTRGEYRLYLIDKNDPRGLFLGMHTHCCQEPGGAGASCAWWGVENRYSGFYIVEDAAGKIVAQAWTWRHGDVVVFDNIEGSGIQSTETRAMIVDMFKELGEKIFRSDTSVKEVRIGETIDRKTQTVIDWHLPEASHLKLVKIVPPPLEFAAESESPYTDSSDNQYVIAYSSAEPPTKDYPGGSLYFGKFGRFRTEFAQKIKYLIETNVDEVADMIASLDMPCEIMCEETSRDEVDAVTSHVHVRCELYIERLLIDSWTKTVSVAWEGSNFSSVSVEDRSLSFYERYPEDSTRALLEELHSRNLLVNYFDDAEALVDNFDIKPPEPPTPASRTSRYAVVENEETIFDYYRDMEDAQTMAEMLNLLEGDYFQVYERLRHPEDDEEHDEDDELYGWTIIYP